MTAISLEELQHGLDLTLKGTQEPRRSSVSNVKLFTILFAATAALTIRVEILRRLLATPECSTRSVEVFLPFFVAIYDALRFQKSQNFDAERDVDASAYDDLIFAFKSKWLSSRWRYVPVAFGLSFGCYLVAGLWLSSESSYVCPLLSWEAVAIPRLQIVAVLLDTFLVIAALELAIGNTQPTSYTLSTPRSWTIVMLLSSAIWIVIAIVVYHTEPEHINWLLLRHDVFQSASLLTLLYRAVFLSIFCLSTLCSVSLKHPHWKRANKAQTLHGALLHTSMALTAVLTIIPGFRFLWSAKRPYPPLSSVDLTWSFVIIYMAWSLYGRIRRAIHPSESQPPLARRLVIFVIFLVGIFPGLMKTNTVYFHPIELLMYDAQNQHIAYLNTAATSKNLADAVRNYQARYHEHPPPGFDIWFDYARNRSVWVTDEFDQIYNDLLPFRSIVPAHIRQQTWEDVSNPWNEISGISIRDGAARLQDNVIPTHRWMLEGIASMINQFSQYLPDMDLAFNLNDEPRIAMRHTELELLQKQADLSPFDGSSTWTTDRAAGWKGVPSEPTSDTVYDNWSFRNTFQEWGIAGCPSSSLVRRSPASLFKSQLCLECAAVHSIGHFLSNWSMAADPCHQPDLANLHGFYLSPAAFKATHLLRPIFSQSKAHGYNDILYPSAWNYIDKVAYAPVNSTGEPGTDSFVTNFPDLPFSEKQETLYWRGASSEGVSDGHGTWRGMVRQRLVHMADNLTASRHDRITLLLPDRKRQNRYTYTTVPGTSLPNLNLNSSAHFVDGIARCGGIDCLAQEQEFANAPHVDFQAHWQYKYLMDLDGAGFSGRFLPFLKSGSLPFKVGLFREWYDSRLVPWLHFVPQDIRLHGLWSTLAYFAGVKGIDGNGGRWEWKGHEREAELIAEGGREWAEKAITKADMEVYMFRLLLEWGRLTDDNRDNLGFTLS